MALRDMPGLRASRPWKAVREETRELAWLVAMVAVLSVAAVALAIGLAVSKI